MIELLLFLILCVLLFGAGAVLAGLGWVAFIAVALSIIFFFFIAIGWMLPKIPRAAASFARGYFKVLAAPILGPVGYWRSTQERRARGEHVGVISTSLTLLWTFIVSVFLSAAAFGLLFAFASTIYEASSR